MCILKRMFIYIFNISTYFHIIKDLRKDRKELMIFVVKIIVCIVCSQVFF